MSKTRKLLAMILSMAMVLSMLPVGVSAAEADGGTLLSSGTQTEEAYTPGYWEEFYKENQGIYYLDPNYTDNLDRFIYVQFSDYTTVVVKQGQYLANGATEPSWEKPEDTGYIYVTAIKRVNPYYRSNIGFEAAVRVELHNYVNEGATIYTIDITSEAGKDKPIQFYLPTGTNSTISTIKTNRNDYSDLPELSYTFVGHGTLNLTDTDVSMKLHSRDGIYFLGGTVNCAGHVFGGILSAADNTFGAFSVFRGAKLKAMGGIHVDGSFVLSGGEVHAEWPEGYTLLDDYNHYESDYTALWCENFYSKHGYLYAKGFGRGICVPYDSSIARIMGGEIYAECITTNNGSYDFAFCHHGMLDQQDSERIDYQAGKLTLVGIKKMTDIHKEFYHKMPNEKNSILRITTSNNKDGSDPILQELFGNIPNRVVDDTPIYLCIEPSIAITNVNYRLYDGDYLTQDFQITREKPKSGGYVYRDGMCIELHDFDGGTTRNIAYGDPSPIEIKLFGKNSFKGQVGWNTYIADCLGTYKPVMITGDGELYFSDVSGATYWLTIYSGTVTFDNFSGVREDFTMYGGKVTINGGNILTQNSYSPGFDIYGGELYVNSNDRVMRTLIYPEIHGGIFKAKGQFVINDWHVIYVGLGPWERYGTKYNGIMVEGGVNVNGGYFEVSHHTAPVIQGELVFPYAIPGKFTAIASVNEDGSDPVDYNPNDWESYKYVCVMPYVKESEQPERDADGTYLIRNAGELKRFAEIVNGGEYDANARLLHNVYFRNITMPSIGTKEAPYTGSFDGGGHRIDNVPVSAEKSYGGLFGYVKDAEIKNFSITGTMELSAPPESEGFGVIGYAEGTNVFADIKSSVDITFLNENSIELIGGIVGGINGNADIDRCIYEGKIEAKNTIYADGVGGIVGGIEAGFVDICDCSFTNNIAMFYNGATLSVGGIVGRNSGDLAIKNTINVRSYINTKVKDKTGVFIGSFENFEESDKEKLYNNYYLDKSTLKPIGNADVTDGFNAIPEDQFTSGEIAYRLGKLWGQNIGTDKYPVLGGHTVVPYQNGYESKIFSDDTSTLAVHHILSAGDSKVIYYSGSKEEENRYIVIYAKDKESEMITYYNRIGLAKEGFSTVVADFGGIELDGCELYIAEENYIEGSSGHIVSSVKITLPEEQTFELNGGTINSEYLAQSCGTDILLPKNLTKDGCKFMGWYTSFDFAGEVVTSVSRAEAGTIKLYAKWYENGGVIEDENDEFAGYHSIFDAVGLLKFAEKVNQGETDINGVLMTDIDMSDTVFTPIGNAENKYRGVFDGNGHKINNFGLNITQKNVYGLFGYVDGGTVKNFTVNGYVEASFETDSGADFEYGVIGNASKGALIENVHSTVNLTVLGDNTSTKTKDIDRIAGIVGTASTGNVTIERCSFGGTIDLCDSGVYTTGGIAGYIIGGSYGVVKDCSFYGKITTTYDGARQIGGIVAYYNGENLTFKNNMSIGWFTVPNNTTEKGYLIGVLKNHTNTAELVTNNYIWDNGYNPYGTYADDAYYMSDEVAAKTYKTVNEMQILNGELAYKLGTVWGQEIGVDRHPVVGGMPVYDYVERYSNRILNDFAILFHGQEGAKATAEVTIPERGEYTIIFADYDEDGELNILDEVTKSFERGFITVTSSLDITLNEGDKIMLCDSSQSSELKCAEYVVMPEIEVVEVYYKSGYHYLEEEADMLFDNNPDTRWHVSLKEPDGAAVVFKYSTPVIMHQYTLTSGTDIITYPHQIWNAWTLYGRHNDYSEWVELHKVENAKLPKENCAQSDPYVIENNTASYQQYKLEVNGIDGNTGFQMSEFKAVVERSVADFAINSFEQNGAKATAVVAIPESGEYTVIFADYDEDGRLNMLDKVTKSFEKGITTVTSSLDISINAGDKIMLWDSLDSLKPKCAALYLPLPEIEYFVEYFSDNGGFRGEGAKNLFDGSANTKWCSNLTTHSSEPTVIFKYNCPAKMVSYTLTTAADTATNSGRNWTAWTLYGSDSENGEWTEIHKVEGANLPPENCVESEPFVIKNNTARYEYYKLVIDSIEGGDIQQMSEFTAIVK